MQNERAEKPEQVEHPRVEYDRKDPGEAKSWELWFGLLSGPVIWAAHFSITYALASTACQLGFLIDRALLGINALTAALIIITIAAIAGLVYGIFLSFRNWKLLKDEGQEGVGQPERSRPRFMAFSGLALGIIFLASVVISLLPSFFFSPCQ
jgi:hypothetical protein